MNILIKDDYAQLSDRASEDLISLVETLATPLICVASGDTPMGMYKALTNKIKERNINISNWQFLGLDEWGGMNGSDEGSCRYHLNLQFFEPLSVLEKNICFFDGRAKDLDEECNRIETCVKHHNGIDVAILGLGMNGHIGMNEPGTPVALRSHVTAIDAVTQKVGQKYFTKQQQLDKGITLGLATLLEAKHIMLMVSGAHKAEIVHAIMNEKVSEQLPATLLRDHPGLNIYLDKAAATLIPS